MLYIVIRQIENRDEAVKHDHRVFVLLDQAKRYYAAAEHVCWNEPNDTPGTDSSLVTNCWLWAVDSDDPVAAAGTAFSHRATLLAGIFPPKED
jgi:hypothetical protein